MKEKDEELVTEKEEMVSLNFKSKLQSKYGKDFNSKFDNGLWNGFLW